MKTIVKKLNLDNAQENILKLIKKWKANEMTLDEIKDYTWLSSSSAVFYKLKQLVAKGYIRKDDNGNYIPMDLPIDAIYYFPFIGFAQCGNFIDPDFWVSQVSENIPFPTKEISLNGAQDVAKYFFTRAVWDSMLPRIKNTDLLLIKMDLNPNPNDATLVLHNGTPKIKNVIPKWETFILVSWNKNVPEYEIAKNDELKVVGVVKKIISST